MEMVSDGSNAGSPSQGIRLKKVATKAALPVLADAPRGTMMMLVPTSGSVYLVVQTADVGSEVWKGVELQPKAP